MYLAIDICACDVSIHHISSQMCSSLTCLWRLSCLALSICFGIILVVMLGLVDVVPRALQKDSS